MMKRLPQFILCGIVIWLFGFVVFAHYINTPPQDDTTHTDAIIALTGGRNRIAEAIKLLNTKKADYLFISGVEKNNNLQEILNHNHIAVEAENKVILGKSAQNTVENAQESKNWMNTHNIKSIRLVTSNYHIPRSTIEFEAINPNLKIIKHPVYSERVNKKWWTSWRTFSLIFSEYNKFLYVYIRTKIQTTENN